jgi:putative endonuclease
MFFYTYILKSLKDKDFYIGWTNDLKGRIEKHNKGLVNATRNRKPLRLEYFEACRNKDKAIEREKYFKTGFGRRFLKNRI